MDLQTLILLLIGIYLIYRLIKLYPVLIFNRAAKAITAKDYEKGIKLLEKAVDKGVDPMREIRAAYAELKFGDVKKAKKKFNMVLLNSKIKPNFKNEAKSMMAIALLNDGEKEEALEVMGNLYKIGYKNTNFFASYGYIAALSGDSEFYNKVNDEAYDYNSDNLVICDNYAFCRYLDGEYEKAAEVYESFIEKEPNFPEAYYNYAVTLMKLGDNEKAKEMLEQALTKEFFGITTIKREQVENLLNQI